MNAESEKSVNELRKIMDQGDELRKFIRPKEAIRIYSLSRTFIEEIAKEAGAMYKIGKTDIDKTYLIRESFGYEFTFQHMN